MEGNFIVTGEAFFSTKNSDLHCFQWWTEQHFPQLRKRGQPNYIKTVTLKSSQTSVLRTAQSSATPTVSTSTRMASWESSSACKYCPDNTLKYRFTFSSYRAPLFHPALCVSYMFIRFEFWLVYWTVCVVCDWLVVIILVLVLQYSVQNCST